MEGDRAIEEAARSGYLSYLVLSAERHAGMRCPGGKSETAESRHTGIPSFLLPAAVFSDLSDVGLGTGWIGVARIPAMEGGPAFPAGSGSLLVYLDGLQEPGNVGGIIRTAWALGISGMLLSKGCADPFSPKGVRASAGAVFHLPVFRDCSFPDLKRLREEGFSVFLAEADGPDFGVVSFPARSILVLGSEGRGISRRIREGGRSIGVPMKAGVDSLNVVVAGSILLEGMVRRISVSGEDRGGDF